MVVTNVASAAMPDANPTCWAEVAATWEKLLQQIDEGVEPADVIAALDGGDIAEETRLGQSQTRRGLAAVSTAA